jgi:hypothetical protein
MAGLASLLEDYRNWRGRQEWQQGYENQKFAGGDPGLTQLFDDMISQVPIGSLKAYRGHIGLNREGSTMAPGYTFLSTNKDAAKQYGNNIDEYDLNAKLLDLSHTNPEARRLTFLTSPPEDLEEFGINHPDDFIKNPDAFDELSMTSQHDMSLGMFPGKYAKDLLKAYGYNGVKTGLYDLYVIGNPSNYK